MAARIHAVQMAAYLQEAALIGSTDFPPLQRTVHDVMTSAGDFFGVFVNDALAGVAQSERSGTSSQTIASLVVASAYQRRGIGRGLLQYLVKLHGGEELRVQTAVLNLPALALYRQHGFVERRRWRVGPPTLELVMLVRKPGASSIAA